MNAIDLSLLDISVGYQKQIENKYEHEENWNKKKVNRNEKKEGNLTRLIDVCLPSYRHCHAVLFVTYQSLTFKKYGNML